MIGNSFEEQYEENYKFISDILWTEINRIRHILQERKNNFEQMYGRNEVDERHEKELNQYINAMYFLNKLCDRQPRGIY